MIVRLPDQCLRTVSAAGARAGGVGERAESADGVALRRLQQAVAPQGQARPDALAGEAPPAGHAAHSCMTTAHVHVVGVV